MKAIIFILFYLNIFNSVYSQSNWIWQNPSPTGNDLYNVQFTDLNTGYAVGYDLTVLKTTNSGENWTSKFIDKNLIPPGLTEDLKAIYFVNSLTGYVGRNGIFKTTNGGDSWSFGNIFSVNSLYFTSVDTGFAACDGGKIFATTNGGDDWFLQFSIGDLTNNFNKINFISKDTGFVVGGNQTILKTTDRGNNWILKNGNMANPLYDLNFISSLTGFASGGNGKIVKTTNGGDNWIYQSSVTSRDLNNIYFLSNDTGYVISNYANEEGKIFKTINGGNSWTLLLQTEFFISKICFLEQEKFLFSGYAGNIYKTTNSGIAWDNKIKSLSTSNLYSLSFISENTGFIAGSTGTVLNTTNAGLEWRILNSPSTTENYAYIKFFDGINGYLSGSNLYKTSTGGKVWLNLVDSTALQHTQFVNKDTGFYLSNNNIYRTFDGGYSWEAHFIAPSTSTFCFLKNSNIGFALTSYRTGVVPSVYYHNDVYKTTNSGSTWQLKQSFNNGWGSGYYSNITFFNENIGFISGYMGIKRTIDGSESWVQLTTPGPYYPTSEIYFCNQNVGYVSSYKTIYKTTNSGNNWIQVFETFHSTNSFSFTDNNTGFSVGNHGNILKTTNGGGIFVNVAEKEVNTPESFHLYQNYPNPFNPVTKIEFNVAKNAKVKLEVYDILGKFVRSIVNSDLSAGRYSYEFDGSNLSSGIYFYKIETENLSQTKRMILLK